MKNLDSKYIQTKDEILSSPYTGIVANKPGKKSIINFAVNRRTFSNQDQRNSLNTVCKE